MNKQIIHFGFIVFVLVISILYTGIICYSFHIKPFADDKFLYKFIPTTISIILLIVLISSYRIKYLLSNNKTIQSRSKRKKIVFTISGILPLLIDISQNSIDFDFFELTIIAIVIVGVVVYRRFIINDHDSYLDKLIYSLYLGFLGLTIYLMFFILYYSIFHNGISSNVLEIFSRILGVLPNTIARLFLLIPIIVVITIPSIFISKSKKRISNGILDSNSND